MRTLVLYGSPRKNSHTKQMLDKFLENIEGEVKIVDCYDANISPCIDCKFCFHKSGCSIKDDMMEIYEYMHDCDAIIIATPMHFSIPSSPMIKLFSRLQTYWSNEFVRKNHDDKPLPKKGVLLVTTGADWPDIELIMDGVADIAFNHLNVDCIGKIYAKQTDDCPIEKNQLILDKIEFLSKGLNKFYKN